MSELERNEQESSVENVPKPLSLKQNLILTLKIFAIGGTLVGLLWYGSEAVNR